LPKPFDSQEIEGTHGFIVPNGEFIALEDVDRMCVYVGSVYDSAEKIQKLFGFLAMECVGHGMHAAACAYLARRLPLLESAEAKADCLLKMGQTMEQAGDFEKALEHYTRAFDLPEGDDDTWYFLNNNRGYCLNVLGRHSEAQEFCQAAIEIDPDRYNAWKNFGISLEKQGKMEDAALSYCEATDRGPEDPRAFRLLEDLLMAHPELLDQYPVLKDRYSKCFALMRTTAGRAGPRIQ
jgi:tetratricopeptide (TPR) repeat protein